MKESLSANTTISHYRILSPIGAGGMGEVYLAEDAHLERKVAIKLLPAESIADEQAKKRLVREARAAAKLDHPNICPIHEVGEEDGRSFIVMQYVEGETLAVRIANKPLELGEVLDIAAQVVDALVEAHSRGIIHRDIKPANIMLTVRGQAKLMDFGLARAVQQKSLIESEADTVSLLTAPGTIIGTMPYMSPEQVKGEAVDARTDIFSLGVVLYEMISSHQPFKADSMAATISAILTREPPPVSRYARELPEAFEWIVSKALRKNSDERYQTAKELLTDLISLKHRLEFEAELERSRSPEEHSEAGKFGSTEQSAVASAKLSVAQTGEVTAAPTTSIAGRLISQITHHRRAVVGALFALVIAIVILAYLFHSSGPGSAIDSIAVLPLVNANGDPNTEYLSDGLTESLINSLSQLRTLRVVARSTVFHYKGKETDSLKVGHELGVRAVLSGRVVQRGETLTIQAELVDVGNGSQLWGEQYDRRLTDLLAIKQEIAREITEKLRLRLSGEEQQQLAKRETGNTEAYQLYLKGRYYWNKRTTEGIKKAIEHFQQAVDKDQNYALAYAGLADCYVMLEQYAGTPASEALAKAKAYGQRALQLDDSLAVAHGSLGITNDQLWQFGEAEQEYKRAISLNPNYPTAHQWYSAHLRNLQRLDEALAEIKRAQELDPLSLIISENVAATYLLKGDLDAAMEQARKMIELDPNYPGGHRSLGLAYLRQRRYPEAIAEYQRAVDLSGRASNQLSGLGYGYALAGKRAEALAIAKELEEKYAKREASEVHIAPVYVGLGEKDQAFAWLEKAFQTRSSLLRWIASDPVFDSLRSDPRYGDLLRRMGLDKN